MFGGIHVRDFCIQTRHKVVEANGKWIQKSKRPLFPVYTTYRFHWNYFLPKKSSPFENYSVDSNKNNEHFFLEIVVAVDFHSIHLHYIELEE